MFISAAESKLGAAFPNLNPLTWVASTLNLCSLWSSVASTKVPIRSDSCVVGVTDCQDGCFVHSVFLSVLGLI